MKYHLWPGLVFGVELNREEWKTGEERYDSTSYM